MHDVQRVTSLADRRETHSAIAARWCTARNGPCEACIRSVPALVASIRCMGFGHVIPPGSRGGAS